MRDTVKIYKSITYRTAALRSLGRKGEATRLMQSAVSLAPGLRVRGKAGLYNNIGYVLLDSLPAQARGYFEKAISYMPISCGARQPCAHPCRRGTHGGGRLAVEQGDAPGPAPGCRRRFSATSSAFV